MNTILIILGSYLVITGCQTDFIPQYETAPLPLTMDEDYDGLGVEAIDEEDLEAMGSKDSYEPFNPKGLFVFFNVNQSKLSPKSRQTLEKIIMGMRKDPLSRIIIRSHADSVGSQKANLILSRKRSMEIKNYLVARGIESKRLQVDFAGEAETIDTKQKARDRRLSRRAEFILDYSLKAKDRIRR